MLCGACAAPYLERLDPNVYCRLSGGGGGGGGGDGGDGGGEGIGQSAYATRSQYGTGHHWRWSRGVVGTPF